MARRVVPMPKHDQPCRIPVAHPPHPPHPSGVDRQAREPWCPGGPGTTNGPTAVDRAEQLALAVMATVLDGMTVDERRRCLARLDERYGPPRVGGWVRAACGHVWPDPPALLVDPAQPRICIECPPTHPAAVGRSSSGFALMSVTYYDERPGGGT